jgi:hypothetical protein
MSALIGIGVKISAGGMSVSTAAIYQARPLFVHCFLSRQDLDLLPFQLVDQMRNCVEQNFRADCFIYK